LLGALLIENYGLENLFGIKWSRRKMVVGWKTVALKTSLGKWSHRNSWSKNRLGKNLIK
jgi:hypothetical protein